MINQRLNQIRMHDEGRGKLDSRCKTCRKFKFLATIEVQMKKASRRRPMINQRLNQIRMHDEGRGKLDSRCRQLSLYLSRL